MRELTEKDFERSIPTRQRKRIMGGEVRPDDVSAIRRFVGMTQSEFARAIEISIDTLQNWEQGRRAPQGPAVALLRIAARHPQIIRENAETAA